MSHSTGSTCHCATASTANHSPRFPYHDLDHHSTLTSVPLHPPQLHHQWRVGNVLKTNKPLVDCLKRTSCVHVVLHTASAPASLCTLLLLLTASPPRSLA